MSDFLTHNALWLSPVLAVLLLGTVVGLVVLWRGRSGGKRISSSVSADQSVQAFLEKSDLEIRLAEQSDRMRMITDVHDAAAASLTGMISQAEGATFTAVSDPQVASRAAAAIADSARATLNDIRRVVNASRGGVEQASEGPSLISIHDLFEAMNESGITVTFEEAGEPFPLVPSAELAVYRIVQEGLNNSRAHGGPGTTVKVRMSWSAQGLHLRLDDDGVRAQRRFASEDSPAYTVADDQAALVEMLQGRGMKDMKNRTEAFGGVFSAHRVPGVGFNVSAAFPTLKFHNGIHGVELRGVEGSEGV